MKAFVTFIIGMSALIASLFCKSPQRPEKNLSVIEAKELNQEIKCTLDSIKQNGEEVKELKKKIKDLKKP